MSMGLNWFKKKQKKRVKEKIAIIQKDHTLEISGEIGKSEYMVKELWLKARNEEESYKIAQIADE